ncbi:cation diffusion facilitator family transporter [Rhodobacter ferrooxidans]|uniref:Cation diffusion facilitator family transporter n=1 Tax=Rhodobacter ferrooxidans TaxID=371731 RepID=C8S4J9_9RHOB|nr:cation diffusion facilitator family transporter [Rhodobacter sp. SW2]EEW24082.1 cation diffusion facilitator family transporter [Rhodobacter sp. SW2]
MAHDHAHDHKPPADLGPTFLWAVGLNTAYVIVEATAGFLTGSLALLADAAHNLTDVAGLLIAWGAAVLAKRAGSASYTFGFGRATILAAMLNAIAILIGVVVVVWQAAQRFQTVVEVPGPAILLVALVGIGVNTGSALLFMASKKDDLNAKGAYLHMAADAAVSGAVVLAAAGILLTGWQWLDPAVAIAVSVLIAWTAWGLLRDSLRLELDGVPEAIDRQAVADWLGAQPGVSNVHDLHIWALSTTRTALAVHLVWDGADADAFLDHVTDKLAQHFAIIHATVQLEQAPCERAGACLVE